MNSVKAIEKIEPKPEVDIFLRKPYNFEDRRKEQQNESNGFQEMLDDNMDRLRNEDKSFDDAVIEVIDEHEAEQRMLDRQQEIAELRMARLRFEAIQRYRETMPDERIRKK